MMRSCGDEGRVRRTLMARDAAGRAVREYFRSEGFLEAATPVAVPHPNLDPHVRPVPLVLRDFSGRPLHLWLQTSPELSMKKLLARGSGSIFQICPVFRDGEVSDRHRPEFTMLEWYRVGAGCREVMEDTRRIMACVAESVGGTAVVEWGGRSFDLAGEWEEITVAGALRRVGAPSMTREDLAASLQGRGTILTGNESREELFFRLYLEVESGLGSWRPAFLVDFPEFLGTMARRKPGEEGVLERFEAYVGGLELANGYAELTDADEQGERLERTRRELEEEGAEGLTVDKGFLDAVAGLPPCAGVSVGLDRLLMLVTGASDIAGVLLP